MNGQLGYILRAFMGIAYFAMGVLVLQKGKYLGYGFLDEDWKRYALGGLLIVYGIFRFVRNGVKQEN